jgi:eukaryotic-like serine/threonine-protein kinase
VEVAYGRDVVLALPLAVVDRQVPAMTRQAIQRDKLGALSKIGQGGQGVVYRAPNAKTKFADSMVYKEYKAQVRADIDFTALAAMPALVEESLTYAQAERLISVAAWPCAIIEDGGTPTGFVMPAIPDRFLIALTTAKGVSSSTAEFQHLLNHPTVLVARGINLDDAQRCELLRETASTLSFLHKNGVCVGDISPKNLLFSLEPHEAVYFIDCDAMRINNISVLPQVETPGWNAPPGEELATIYTDTYKLGLLALRLLTGDQDTTNPAHLPPTTPDLLRQIISDTLTSQPQQRPLPEAWTYVLGHAIEHAQHQKKTAPPVSAPLAAPTIPTVRSRPTAYSAPPPRPSAPPPSAPPPAAWAPPPSKSSSNAGAWVGIGLAAVVVIASILVGVAISSSGGGNSSAPSSTWQSSSAAEASTFAPSAAPTSTYTPPLDPQQQLQAFLNQDRSDVNGILDRWVPQLSSKLGVEPWTYDQEDRQLYTIDEILKEHLRLRNQYGAKLLWSGDWTVYDHPNFWVTIAPIPFGSASEALGWCRNNNFDRDHCSAQIISATQGRSGTHAGN